MLVKQLSIFVENKPGRLSAVIKLLGENHINLSALSLADTTNFGVLRLIADKTELAQELLREAGTNVLEDVLKIKVGLFDSKVSDDEKAEILAWVKKTLENLA